MPSDWKKRKGQMDEELPRTIGHEAPGGTSGGGSGHGCGMLVLLVG